jgi:flagellar hook assembly protein FlgD
MAINAYPNPSKGELKIELMGTDQDARVEIFNLRGQRLMRIQDGTLSESGALVYDWDGNDPSGNKQGSGIYLIRVWSKGRPAISKRICIF